MNFILDHMPELVFAFVFFTLGWMGAMMLIVNRSNRKHVRQVVKELAKAERKHPFFAHKAGWGGQAHEIELLQELLESRRQHLELLEKSNSVTGFCVLMCEMWEAEEAIVQGRYDDALEELAQCAAVVVRNMQLVEEAKKEVNK